MAEQKKPFRFGSTFAERKAAREQDEDVTAKAVDAEEDAVEDKAVAPKKTAAKRRSKK